MQQLACRAATLVHVLLAGALLGAPGCGAAPSAGEGGEGGGGAPGAPEGGSDPCAGDLCEEGPGAVPACAGPLGLPGLPLAPLPMEPGQMPGQIATGDLNGDGWMDVAVLNGGQRVSVLLGHDDGTFSPSVDSPVGSGAAAITALDLDGDGALDLAVRHGGGVVVLWNQGDGTFPSKVEIAFTGGGSSIAAGDLNGDGWPDLATTVYSYQDGGHVAVLLNQGNGTFSAPVDLTVTPSGSHPAWVDVADLDGDGALDLAVANGASDNVSLLFQQGGGTFSAPVVHPTGSYGAAPSWLAARDLDGDGAPDIAVATKQGMRVRWNQGNGLFSAETVLGSFGWFAVADLNTDGQPDLVAGDAPGQSSVRVLLGQGNGTYSDAGSVAVATAAASVAVADLDGDGRPDLVAASGGHASSGHGVEVLLNQGSGGFVGMPPAHPVGANPSAVVASDLDGDGWPDLVVSSSGFYGQGGGVAVLLNQGNGTFTAGPPASDTGSVSVAASDLNGDGIPDLALANEGVDVLLGEGDGTFASAVDYSVGQPPYSVTASDLDGDGWPDLVASTQDGVGVLFNQGNGAFSPAIAYPVVGWATESALTVSDLDGDGWPDVATSRNTGNGPVLSLLWSQGNGTFAAPIDLGLGPASSYSRSIASADLDGDGWLDLAMTRYQPDGSRVLVLLSQGNGAFAAPIEVEVGANVSAVTPGDMDGDGRIDLLVTHPYSRRLSVLFNQGGGAFSAPLDYPAGTPGEIASCCPNHPVAAVTDLNGDGNLDVAVTDTKGDAVDVLFSSCSR